VAVIQSFSFARYFWTRRVRHPIYLIYFVTSKCMGRCAHCFYWEQLNREEKPLSVEEADRVASSMGRLLQVTFTGGEPFLRPDFPLLVKAFYRRNRPVNLAIATSGFHPDQVVAGVSEILRDCPQSQVTVGLPIEGDAELNDRVRGVPGFFERTRASFDRLKNLKQHYPRLTLLVDLTASALNQDQLLTTYNLVRKDFRPDVINLILVRGNPRDPAAREFDPDRIEKVLKVMEEDIRLGLVKGFGFFSDLLHAKDILLRRLALDIYRDGRNRLPCTAGQLAGVIRPEGELLPCELLPESFGNLREHNYNVPALWNSPRGKEIRRKIADTKCTCYHQCFLSPSLFFNPRLLPKLGREWLRIRRAK
jgi:MoaA/NifB/PqqE/SkfB family radical SAM enzyme